MNYFVIYQCFVLHAFADVFVGRGVKVTLKCAYKASGVRKTAKLSGGTLGVSASHKLYSFLQTELCNIFAKSNAGMLLKACH